MPFRKRALSEVRKDLPLVSIIIPTFNRPESLLRTLEGLSRQTFPSNRFEVIVINDGGRDEMDYLLQKKFPSALQIVHQENQGATVSRNRGAKISRGEVLVFMDDDIVLEAPTLQILVEELVTRQQTVLLGALYLPSDLAEDSSYARILAQQESIPDREGFIPFQDFKTGLMAIKKPDFFHLQLFQDPTGGWPNWDDVDFGYRAAQEGFKFLICPSASAAHWDHSVVSFSSASDRWYRASKSAPKLFLNHSGLRGLIPMFHDKEPINWHRDGAALILRKLARQIISSKPVMWSMENLVLALERIAPESKSLVYLYRWIISGYIYHGYRTGLKEVSLSPSS